MKTYTVRQVAGMAGVSVRTLHHYDHIELLTPASRTAAGYRMYDEEDLLRLQQILFFRELGFPLGEIRNILNNPAFDRVEALRDHRRLLQARVERITGLLQTIDKTIQKLTEDNMTMNDAELYEGFTQEQIERYRSEARERWGGVVEDTEQRIRGMTKEQWQAVKGESEEVAREIAALMDRDPGDPDVQRQIARHHAWIEQFYPAPAEVYRGLGRLYTEHDEFRQYYDKYQPGLADFMNEAMDWYADHMPDES